MYIPKKLQNASFMLLLLRRISSAIEQAMTRFLRTYATQNQGA
jgi:hypothetical protein